MKRRPMSKGQSNRHFKKNTGIQKMNTLNPRRMRGGIRL
ncbi:MAG: DNA binding protein (J protein) [Microvirus sp.]|nr:MAG: DNA binding protein (J protein) [Microvirus sp.]